MTDRKLTEAEMITYLQMSVAIGSTARLAPEEAQMMLDLINRQKEKIDDLKVEFDAMRGAANSYKMHYKEAQAEIAKLHKAMEEIGVTAKEIKKELPLLEAEIRTNAVKEFAQNFESKIACIPQHHFTLAAVLFDLNKLVKEKTEERDE